MIAVSGRQAQRQRFATALQHVGTAIGWGGHWDEARTYFVEGLELARTVGYERYIATVTAYLGHIAARQGQFDEAERYLAEAVALCRAQQLSHGLTLCVIVYAANTPNIRELEWEAGNYRVISGIDTSAWCNGNYEWMTYS